MRTHLHLILDTLAEDIHHRRLSPVVGRTLAALSLISREAGPLPDHDKLPAVTWAGASKAISDLAERIKGRDADVYDTLKQCAAFAADRHVRDSEREGRSVSPAEVDFDVETVFAVLRRILGNFVGALVGETFDNGCEAKPFFAAGWSGWELTAPAGNKKYVGISLGESDEDGDISAFIYEGESDDITKAEVAVNEYVDVWRG